MVRDLLHAWSFFGMLSVLALAGTATVSAQPALAQTGAPSPSPGSTSHPCHLLTSAQSVPDGLGAAYNVFSAAKELLLSVECGSSSNATLTVGNGQNTTYIYRVAYEWINGTWKEIALSGSQRAASDWYVGTATADLMRSQTQLAEDNFVIAYTCLWQNNAWKCGCPDSSCSQNYWQLQTFYVASQGGSAGGTGSNAHDTKVLNAPGQVSDAYLRSSAAYYLSSDVAAAARKAWNDNAITHRNNFESCHPTKEVSVNDKNYIKAGGCSHMCVIEPEPRLAGEKVQSLSAAENVLRCTSRNKSGWDYDDRSDPDNKPLTNFRHVMARLTQHTAASGFRTGHADYHREGVTYESGMTFWQGGSENWAVKCSKSSNGKCSTAIWQLHGGQAIIYVSLSGGNVTGFIRKTLASSDNVRFNSFPLTKGHDDIHVLKFQYRTGSNGFLKIWYNGVLKVDVKQSMTGFPDYGQDFMNYRNPPPLNQNVEWTLYMDRLYRRAL